jgi:hypothetical protein
LPKNEPGTPTAPSVLIAMNQITNIPPSARGRVTQLDTLLKKTLDRRRALRALRGGRISPLDTIQARIEVIAAVLAWALRNQDGASLAKLERGQEEPPSVQRCSAALGVTRDTVATERLDELVERVYAWSIAIACELLTIENLSFDIEDDATHFEKYAPRAIALLDETIGPMLDARSGDDLALASIRRIVSELRQTLVLSIAREPIAA